MRGQLRSLLVGALFLLVTAPLASDARAAELTGFLAFGTPGENWASGGGAAFAIGLFHLASFEAEGAYLPGEIQGDRMLSLTGSAFLAPSFGKLVPYVGVGAGLARQETGEEGHNETIRTFALGAKLHVAPLVIVKAEYRRIHLSDSAPLRLDNRYTLGAGLSF